MHFTRKGITKINHIKLQNKAVKSQTKKILLGTCDHFVVTHRGHFARRRPLRRHFRRERGLRCGGHRAGSMGLVLFRHSTRRVCTSALPWGISLLHVPPPVH